MLLLNYKIGEYMKDRKTMIIVIITLIVSVIGLGIAFAAFSQTLNISGNAEVEATNWEVVFEGTDGTSTLGSPTLTGTASVTTAPTIKNNQTEISNYAVSLKTPGDSVTYNFRIHNKGSYAANLASLTISGVNRPASPVTGSALVTDSSIATQNASTLAVTEYKLYYTDDNTLVGQNAVRDCLESNEYENVSLRIVFSTTDASDTSILPSSDLVLNNLGVSAVYNQANNGSCQTSPTPTPTGDPFVNTDGAYYTYEGKSFIGTGVNNVLISETIPSKAQWSTAYATECSDGSTLTNYQCPAGTTPVFPDSPAADAASAYCSGCRLMTKAEAESWGCDYATKCIGEYNGSPESWWLADPRGDDTGVWDVYIYGNISCDAEVIIIEGVRPAVSISSTATMTGSGTQGDPYVIQ